MADLELITELLSRLDERYDLQRFSSVAELIDIDRELREQLNSAPELADELERGLVALREIDQCLGCDSSADATRWPDIPGYEIQEELGYGGMGVVYKARQVALNRAVAVKVMLAQRMRSHRVARRFRVEAEAVAQLKHPNIVQVYETGQWQGSSYIVLEYMAGGNLAKRLGGMPQPERWAAEVMRTITLAVDHAHRAGIVHRDLKPSNILIASDGTLKVADFGLAKLLDDEADLTRTGEAPGTPGYMPPEQARGIVSPQSDIYALGAMLYELLTGRPPFAAETTAETLVLVQTQEPIGPRLIRPKLARDLEAICLKCLEKEPRRRYATAGELADDLGRFLTGEPTAARPLSRAQRVTRWARRRPALAGLVAVSAAAIVTIAAGTFFYAVRLNRAATVAEENAARAERSEVASRQEEERANSQLYPAQMRLASLALDRGEHDRARRILAAYDVGQPLSHLRGFEWHMLRQKAERIANDGEASRTVMFQHPDELYWVEFAPDGTRFVTGCKDGHFRIWDVRSKELLHDVAAHTSCVNQARFSPDGRYLASAGCDNRLALWRLAAEGTPELVSVLHEGPSPARCVSWSPDSTLLATGGDDCVIRIWDAQSATQKHNIPTSGIGHFRLEWSPDGQFLASATRRGTADGPVVVWSTETWHQHAKYDPPARFVAFSPKECKLAIVQRNIRQFDVASWIELADLETNAAHCMGLAWSPDARTIATVGNYCGKLCLIDCTAGVVSSIIDVHHGRQVDEVSFSPDGRYVATAARDGMASVTDLTKCDELKPSLTISMQDYPYTESADLMAIDSDRNRFVAFGGDRVDLWDINSRQKTGSFPVSTQEAIRSATTSPTAAAVVTDRATRLLDLTCGDVREIPAEFTGGAVRAQIFDDPGLVTIVCRSERQQPANAQMYSIRVFDLPAFRERQRFENVSGEPGRVTTVVSPNGRYLLVWRIESNILFIDLATSARQTVPSTFWAANPQFSPDSRHFIDRRDELLVRVWDAESLTLLHELEQRTACSRCAFSPDGRTLAILGDRLISLWHVPTGQEMATLGGPPSRPSGCLRFSRDGRRLTLAQSDGKLAEVYIWEAKDAH